MELSKERINEIAYAMLIVALSKKKIELNPSMLKREVGNIPQNLKFLPENFRSIEPKELQEALKSVLHDLVDYSLGFTLKDKKNKEDRQK